MASLSDMVHAYRRMGCDCASAFVVKVRDGLDL